MNIPEKWEFKIEDAECKQLLQQWFNKEFKTENYGPQSHHTTFEFPNYHDGQGFKKGYHFISTPSGKTIISKEEFKVFVLKENSDTYQIF